MPNLNDLIDQWIGEELDITGFETDYGCGFKSGINKHTKELKSRKQELVEGIGEFIKSYGTKLTDVDGQVYIPVEKFIKELTGK